MMVRLVLLVIALALMAAPALARDAFVLVILDDISTCEWSGSPSSCGAYDQVSMPAMDTIATNGLKFQWAFTQALCQPTRYGILTGMDPHRNGVGDVDGNSNNYLRIVSMREPTLFNTLSEQGWHVAHVGKSHVCGIDTDCFRRMGVDEAHAVIQSNVNAPHFYTEQGFEVPANAGYYEWLRCDGVDPLRCAISTEYAQKAVTDAAVSVLSADTEEDLFLQVGFQAAHSPFEEPPGKSCTEGTRSCYEAMIEYMDDDIDRIVTAIEANDGWGSTTLCVIGDNGTPTTVRGTNGYVSNQVKNTRFAGAANVPMVCRGAKVTRTNQTETAMIQATDFYATILDLYSVTGVNDPHDSISFSDCFTGACTQRETVTFSRWQHNQDDRKPPQPGDTEPEIEHYETSGVSLQTNHYMLAWQYDGFDGAGMGAFEEPEGAGTPREVMFDLATDFFEESEIATPYSGDALTAHTAIKAAWTTLQANEGVAGSDGLCD